MGGSRRAPAWFAAVLVLAALPLASVPLLTMPVLMPARAAGATVPTASPAAPTSSAVPTPTAPAPTSTAVSPQAPDPAPPLGGIGPGGRVPGGARLLDRGVVVPPGAPALPAGVTAAAWVLADLGSGTVLAARDPHGRYQPASVLKTLTALVLLPRLAGGQTVPISDRAAGTEGSAVGLAPGGAYTADILFEAMLLESGNDATEALTEAAGGDAAVVAAMNATVRSLGGYDTMVQTPTGLDGWAQLTSAYDLALVLRADTAAPRLLAYDQTLRAQLPAQTVTKGGRPVPAIEIDNQSEDFLTGYPGALLAKTGFTDAARHTYLCAARRGGRTLGVVMLRAERVPTDQWRQAATLLDWGFGLPAGTAPVGTLDRPADLAARPSGRPTSSADPARPGRPARPVAAASATGPGGVALLAPAVGVVALTLTALGVLELRQRARRRRR